MPQAGSLPNKEEKRGSDSFLNSTGGLAGEVVQKKLTGDTRGISTGCPSYECVAQKRNYPRYRLFTVT
jgi:hypothetical protein